MRTVCIDIDSLRADHVSAYGYHGETTPNIDRLAEDGVWFERAYTANSPCMPSRHLGGYSHTRLVIPNVRRSHR